jgi:hypothetical protein
VVAKESNAKSGDENSGGPGLRNQKRQQKKSTESKLRNQPNLAFDPQQGVFGFVDEDGDRRGTAGTKPWAELVRLIRN